MNLDNSKEDNMSINFSQTTSSSVSHIYWRLPAEDTTNPSQISLEKFGEKSVKRAFSKYRKQFPEFVKGNSEEIAKNFCERFFLSGASISVNLANLSLKDDSDKRISLAIRIPYHPAFIALGNNVCVSVIGYCPTVAKNPIFIPERISLTHAQETTDYEKEVDVNFVQLAYDQYPDRNKANLLTAEFTRSLPKFAVETKKRLESWEDFLKFKEKLIKHKTQGIRYLRWEYQDEQGELKFFVIAENEQILKRITNTFRNQNLHAFALDVSQNPYRFELPKNSEKLSSAFANFGQLANKVVKVIQKNDADKELVKARQAFKASLIQETAKSEKNTNNPFNFDKAVFALLSIKLDEELEYRISQFIDEENADTDSDGTGNDKPRSREEKIKNLFKRLPETGFLSISLAGDLALVDRHRRAVDNLMRNESCYAPYLSSYLFDIQNANQPDEISEITEWENPNLNPAQKSAVQKMLAAPDICLIQGPPGTGKTTVIAEACLQFAKRGETVLLASQAHDALDNALSRLQNHPNLRAIRLARNIDRITDDGKAFTGENVLEKQYAALRHYVDAEYLYPQMALQQNIDDLQDWLNKAEFTLDDLSRLRERYRNVQNSLKKEQSELQQLKGIFDKQNHSYHQAKQQQQETIELAEFLKKGNGSIRHFQQPLSDSIYPLVEQLCNLQAVNIKQNFAYSTFIAESENQAAIFESLFNRWLEINVALPKMQADLDKLLLGQGGVDTQTQLKIEELNKTVQILADRLENEDNDELLREWKAKRTELRRLKESSQSSGINGDYYHLFIDEEKFTQNSDLDAVKNLLRLRLAELNAIKNELISSIEQANERLNLQISTENLPLAPNDSLLKQKESEITSLKNGLNTLIEQDKIKQQESQNLVTEHSDDKQIDLATLINNEKQRLSTMQSKLAEIKTQNQDFTPLFERWRTMLNEPQKRAKADWDELRVSYFASCNVVAISCNENEWTLTQNGFDSFDVVIIDEVSKATPLELLLPLMRAKKAILVGDHRQLPPVFNEADGTTFEDQVETNEAELETGEKAKSEPDASDLTQDNLEKFKHMVTASLFKELFEQAPDSLRERLTVQFRMHPEIMRMINFFYEGQLQCGNPSISRPHGLTFKTPHERLLGKNDHILWIDTSDDEQGKRYRITDGNTNVLEAKLIARTLVEMNRQLEASGEYGKHNKMKVGVVSFYQPQCRVIRQEIRNLIKPKKGVAWFSAIDVEINTVIRYQGKEKQVILISVVKNDGGDADKRRSANANVARFEFINVAMSRAQNLLMVFGARNMLENRIVKLPRMDRKGYDKTTVYKSMFNYLEYQSECGGLTTAQTFAQALPNVEKQQGGKK